MASAKEAKAPAEHRRERTRRVRDRGAQAGNARIVRPGRPRPVLTRASRSQVVGGVQAAGEAGEVVEAGRSDHARVLDPDAASPAPTGAATARPIAVGTVPPLPAGGLLLGENDNGRTVTVHGGSKLTVVLASTYWQFEGSSDPAVLRPAGGTVTVPSKPGQCVVGGGCGTTRITFDAVAPGTAAVTAKRTTCGEALQCADGAGSFKVTIQVQ